MIVMVTAARVAATALTQRAARIGVAFPRGDQTVGRRCDVGQYIYLLTSKKGPELTAPALSTKDISEVRDVRLLGADRLGGLLETGDLGVGQLLLDDPLDAVPADLRLDAEVHAGDAVLAVDPRADREGLAGVLDDRLGHPGRGGGRRVVRRAGLEQGHDLGAAVTRTHDKLFDLLGREQVGQRLAVHGAA